MVEPGYDGGMDPVVLALTEALVISVYAVVGVAGWRLGEAAVRRGGRTAVAVLGGALLLSLAAVAGTVAAIAWPAARDLSGMLLSPLGGEGVLGCLTALVLLGAVKATPKRSTSDGFLRLAAALAYLVMLGAVASPLVWRILGAHLRENVPYDGLLTQSTAVSCAPASASMLLDREGLVVSEGLLAEMSRCSPVGGTEFHQLARAADRFARERDLRARAGTLTSADAARRAPFVAAVGRADIGGHAVLVESYGDSTVMLADPLMGGRVLCPRAEFDGEWKGEAVWLEPR